MKTSGIARKVDDLGRIVLPVEIRRAFDIREGDELEVSVDGDHIVLAPIEERCTFCRGVHGLREFKDRRVCEACVADLGRLGTS